jgi:hypothetical protein
MIVAVILLCLCQIVTTFAAVLMLRRIINAKQAELEWRAEKALQSWIAMQGDNKDQPSKLAMMLDGMGAVIGSAAARSLMASLKQSASAPAQVAGGVSDQLMAQGNPILAMLTAGKRGKGAAVLKLAEMLGPMFASKNGSSADEPYQGRRHRE